MNAVEIDREALEREADAAVADVPTQESAESTGPSTGPDAGAPVAPGEITLEQAQAMAQSLAPGVFLIVDASADVMAPAWKVTHDEKTKLSNALAMAFVLWFPDLNVPPKYLALGAVAGTILGIASARRDADGKFKPLREVKEVTDAAAATAA